MLKFGHDTEQRRERALRVCVRDAAASQSPWFSLFRRRHTRRHQSDPGVAAAQDPRRKRFLGRLTQLQPQYSGPAGLAGLARDAPVFATFTNAAPVYVEQLLNWAFHLRELALPHVVVCLDPESEDIAASNGIPWVAVRNQTTSEDVRNDHATFRAMVSRKVRPCLSFGGIWTRWLCRSLARMCTS